MSNLIFQHLSDLSDTTRARLLRALEQSSCTVGELTEALELPQPTVSRHLKILLQHNWVSRQIVGNSARYRFQPSLIGDTKLELWSVVSEQTAAAFPEDELRLRSVLLVRRPNSSSFFQRIGANWSSLRRDMFGERYLLPTLLAALGGDQTVVDVGCGTGEVCAALAAASKRVIGIDASAEMLQLAANRNSHFKNVELQLGAAESLGLAENCADTVLAMLVLHHTINPQKCMSEFHRVLRPGGRLVILDMTAHHHHSYRESMGHKHLGFTSEMLQHKDLELLRWEQLEQPDSALGPQLFLSVWKAI